MRRSSTRGVGDQLGSTRGADRGPSLGCHPGPPHEHGLSQPFSRSCRWKGDLWHSDAHGVTQVWGSTELSPVRSAGTAGQLGGSTCADLPVLEKSLVSSLGNKNTQNKQD